MKQVNNLLQFIRSTRDQNWLLHLASLEQMCVYFFAYNRHDYAQNIPDYIAHMYHLEHSHPSVWQDLKSGDFVVSTNPVPFTSIGPDHAQEHVNKIHKGEGAISGLTTDPQGLLKYCLSTPVLARLAGETERLLNIADANPKKHHQHSMTRSKRQERSVKQLKDVLSGANPFSPPGNDESEMKLINFVSNQILPTAVQNDVLDIELRGRRARETFVNERVRGEKNMWDKMPKLKYLTWKDGCKTIKLKASSEVVSLKSTNSLFVRLLLVAKSSRELDLQNIVGTYEFADHNASLMKSDGSLLPTSAKCALIHELEGVVSGTASPEESIEMQSSPSANVLASILIDGMAVVQEMVVRKGEIKCCRDLAECFTQSVDMKAGEYTDIYLLFDNYTVTKSMKDRTRQIRTAGRAQDKGYKIEDSTPIKDFKAFLGTKETKVNLVLYLAQKAVELCKLPITTHTHKGVMSTNTNMVNITSTQEEADTLLVLYAVAVSRLGKTPHIYSCDTDVLVLALRRVPDLQPESTIIMGTGDQRRMIKLRTIYMTIGPERAAALPGFHTLTGCDTTGHIRGKGKSTCLKLFMKAGDDVLHALAELGVGPCPSSEVLAGCEKFMCQLFKSGYESAEVLRWHMFKQLKANQGVEKICPTQGSIVEHILRAHWQANVWAQDIVAQPKVLDPLSLGWRQQKDGSCVPVVSKFPPAPEAVVELVKCACVASKCTGRCSCKVNNLPCTELCKCEAAEDSCKNLPNDDAESDDDDDDDACD